MASSIPLNIPYSDLLVSLDPDIVLVGGAIRDALLGREVKDFDFLSRNAYKVAESFAKAIGGKSYRLKERGTRKTVSVVKGDMTFDFSVLDEELHENLRKRDFTINAVSIYVKNMKVYDPLNGLTDIKNRVLKLCSEASIDIDPGRILRAFRFAGAFGFLLHKDTQMEIVRKKGLLRQLSPDRLKLEMFKILKEGKPVIALEKMMDLSVLGELIPELLPSVGCKQNRFHKYDVWKHTLVSIDSVEKALQDPPFPVKLNDWKMFMVRLSLLLHDSGKPYTKSVGKDGEIHFYGHEGKSREIAENVAERFHLSKTEKDALTRLVLYHMRPMEMEKRRNEKKLTPREMRRFMDRVGDILDMLYVVVASDIMGKGINVEEDLERAKSIFATLHSYYVEEYLPKKRKPLVRGRDLIEWGFEPSPLFGEILSFLNAMEMEGKIKTKEEAKKIVFEKWGTHQKSLKKAL